VVEEGGKSIGGVMKDPKDPESGDLLDLSLVFSTSPLTLQVDTS
jgi:hypothetical protein